MEILTDSVHKVAYATDASVYREIPYGVAYPKDEEDMRQLLCEARRRGTSIIARAGGTSIAGQVVGKGIVMDVSKYMNRILEINAEERYAWVEPGVVRDELNIACKPHGLFFSPETSTSNRCCIGGMVGNNSCGTHSLVYGSTRGRVLEADGVLADGSKVRFAEYTVGELEKRFGTEFWDEGEVSQKLPKINQKFLEKKIYAQLILWALDAETRRLIEETYPDKDLKRRSCGYAIDEVIEDLCNESKPLRERTINLCRLIAGSEGTLALLTRIKVALDVLPPKEVMVVCAHCVSLDAAFEANLIALRHHPTAVELMDGEIMTLACQIGNWKLEIGDFVKGEPPALLISELRGESREEMDKQADGLEKALIESGLVSCCTRVYGSEVAKVWNLRKAGLGILNGMPGDAKPTGVIEDTAVAAKNMPAYMRDFREMLERLGTSCVFYGHISTGELHLRPILNLKTEEGKRLFRQIAHETTLLVRKHRGTISGEHGDGRLRGEFIPLQYGEKTYELMREVKHCWDKDAILNPNKIVDTPRMDEDLRADRSVSGDELLCRVEQCNGAADCRKSTLIGGMMCPAYKVSGDELRTPRARANVLREWMTKDVRSEKLDVRCQISDEDVVEVLSSCLACKACKRECPSGVDMTRLRAEVLQKLYDKHGTPLRTWMVAHNGDVQRLGALMPSVYNWFAQNKWSSKVLKKIVGFAEERSIPLIKNLKLKIKNSFSANRHVYFFLDEFTRYQEPELAETFVKLMNRLGYEVVVPKHTESGRAAISKGCLRQAKRLAEKNIRLLKDKVSDETPLVGIEPSCILSFRDEYPEIVGQEYRDAAKELAKNCMLFDEFMMREVEAGRIRKELFSDMEAEIWLHGHCHQKALVGVEKTAALLRLPENATVHVIPSGCCGMAGSFGYEKAHYRTSLEIGEMILFPAVREAVAKNEELKIKNAKLHIPIMFVAAPGTSCRTQIKDGTGVKALHPIEILYRMLRDAEPRIS